MLLDGERRAGAHQLRVADGTLAAGVYVVRLVSGDAQPVGRLTVVR